MLYCFEGGEKVIINKRTINPTFSFKLLLISRKNLKIRQFKLEQLFKPLRALIFIPDVWCHFRQLCFQIRHLLFSTSPRIATKLQCYRTPHQNSLSRCRPHSHSTTLLEKRMVMPFLFFVVSVSDPTIIVNEESLISALRDGWSP